MQINMILYEDENRIEVFREPQIYKRLYAAGQSFVHDYVHYRVEAVSIRDKIEFVTLKKLC
jgi:hypothetical protein